MWILFQVIFGTMIKYSLDVLLFHVMYQVTIDISKSFHIFLWANEVDGFQCDETNGYHSSTVEGPTINQCVVTNPVVTMSGCEPSNIFKHWKSIILLIDYKYFILFQVKFEFVIMISFIYHYNDMIKISCNQGKNLCMSMYVSKKYTRRLCIWRQPSCRRMYCYRM